jgi:hypothetical protein
MSAVFASATIIALVSGEGSRALFSTPAGLASPMRAPAYGEYHVASTVESAPYFQPVVPALAVQRGQPERPFAIYAVAAALCGVVATVATINRGQPRAVAELNLDSAASATKIAMFATSGRAKRPAPKKKPATRKPTAKKDAGSSPFSFFGSGSVKPTAKTTARTTRTSTRRRVGKKVEEEPLPFAGQLAVTLLSAPLLFAKAFFSEKNWAIQAFKILQELPGAGGQKKDNTMR